MSVSLKLEIDTDQLSPSEEETVPVVEISEPEPPPPIRAPGKRGHSSKPRKNARIRYTHFEFSEEEEDEEYRPPTTRHSSKSPPHQGTTNSLSSTLFAFRELRASRVAKKMVLKEKLKGRSRRRKLVLPPRTLVRT